MISYPSYFSESILTRLLLFLLCSSVFSSASSSDFIPFAVELRFVIKVFSPFWCGLLMGGMKNVYRKGKVHPQPAQASAPSADAYSVLRLLPLAVAALSSALPAEDQEVLAYLIARSPDVLPLKENRRNSVHLSSIPPQQFPWSHRPSFECSCFQCYTCFWSRWDASPNRQTIHEAIDLYEEHMADAAKRNSKGKNRKGFREKNHSADKSAFNASSPTPSASNENENEKARVSVVQMEEEGLEKEAPPNLKQAVLLQEDAECSSRGTTTPPPPPPPLLPIGGRGIMRRVFPNVMSFIADHLWTAWTSPTAPEH